MFSIAGKMYCMKNRIGDGSSGRVYHAYDVDSNRDVAFKEQSAGPAAALEVEVLTSFQSSVHCPRHFGGFEYADSEKKLRSVTIMQLLYLDLFDLQVRCLGRRFSLGTSVRLTLQGLEAIEEFHRIGYIHRDVKPSNFAMGKEKENESTLYLIDYGLAKQYKDHLGNVLQPAGLAQFVGTVRYASLNAHVYGQELSRRDDLLSLFYSFYEMLIGSVPWQMYDGDNKSAGIMKFQHTPESLAEHLPGQMLGFITHIRSLAYEDKPNYKYLGRCLRDILKENGLALTGPFDWQLDNSQTVQLYWPQPISN